MEYLITIIILFGGIVAIRSAGSSRKIVSLVDIQKQNQNTNKQKEEVEQNGIENPAILEIFKENIKNPPVKVGEENFPEVSSRSVMVLDVETGTEIFQKDSDIQAPIASITKIITALIAYEKADFSREIVISPEAVKTEGNAGDLIIGETFRMSDLLKLMLLTSSNDAAIQVGMEISGNLDDFKLLMNKKIKEYGLEKSFFVEPSGIDDKNLSSAREIAQLVSKTYLDNSPIWSILRKETLEVKSLEGDIHFLKNTNELISDEFIFSGKTGYTSKAKGTLAIIADSGQNNRKIVAVILGSEDRFGDMGKILEWVRNNYQFSN